MIVALASGDESRCDRIGETGQGGDVQVDHLFHLVDIRLQDRRDGAEARIVDEHADAWIVAKQSFDLRQVGFVVQIGRPDRDLTGGLAPDPSRDGVQPLPRCGR